MIGKSLKEVFPRFLFILGFRRYVGLSRYNYKLSFFQFLGTGQSKVILNKSTIYVVGIVVAVLFVLLVVDIKLKLDASKPATQAEGEGHQQNHQVNHSHQKSSPTFKQTTLILKKDCQPKKIYCADVLHEAVKGHWSKQHHTINPWQQDSIEKIRTKLGLPIHMTRKDSR